MYFINDGELCNDVVKRGERVFNSDLKAIIAKEDGEMGLHARLGLASQELIKMYELNGELFPKNWVFSRDGHNSRWHVRSIVIYQPYTHLKPI